MTISYHRPFAVSTKPGSNKPVTSKPVTPKPGTPPKRKRWLLWLLAPVALLLLAFLALEGFGWYLGQRQQPPVLLTDDSKQPPSVEKLQKANESLRRKIAALAPKGPYVVIDTAGNRVFLREGDKTLREMVASCGSGNVLEDPASGRRWIFDTPRGDFKVQVKKTDPVWIKPDWAFIEEGEAIPKDGSGRAEPGMMGDYALGLGRGYFIHGTLYKRLLGRNVSHGCVRLGDEDLEHLYKTVPLGTRVIIY